MYCDCAWEWLSAGINNLFTYLGDWLSHHLLKNDNNRKNKLIAGLPVTFSDIFISFASVEWESSI